MTTFNQPGRPVQLQHVSLSDPFWSDYARLVRETVIPYQYETLHDRVPGVEPSHVIRNFRIAAGLEEGEFGGFVFQDSDLAKWLEAVGYSLMTHPDPELERQADEAIELIGQAQQPDGYLNTFFTIQSPGKRWTNLTDCHELYVAGHMIEAAVAYYRATGKTRLLDIVCKFTDHIAETFGTGEGKLNGYDGHQEIELALVKLYETTGKKQYLHLAQFFIDQRGTEPHFFHDEWERRGRISHWSPLPGKHGPDLKYFQAHLPVREQEQAVGHAVRAVYMYTAMADLALHLQDETLAEACRRLWRNVTGKQMYITGGIGSTRHGEAFTFDYDLPNDTIYAETCASIGLIFFASRMLRLEPRSEYADVMERALYNTVIAGMARDGRHFFYVNPLEVWPEASHRNPDRQHVKPVRPGWFSCACCPPNVARLLASLGEYVYTTASDILYTHLYIGGAADVELDGKQVRIVQESALPWAGNVSLRIESGEPASFTLALRIPAWATEDALTVNGQPQELEGCTRDGYAHISRVWSPGDTLQLELGMDAQIIRSHPQLRANAGRIALTRGPLVYALEAADNPGGPLSALRFDPHFPLKARFDPDLLGGAVVLEGEAWREQEKDWPDSLYSAAIKTETPVAFRAIPYYLWGNRGEGEMTVWFREKG